METIKINSLQTDRREIGEKALTMALAHGATSAEIIALHGSFRAAAIVIASYLAEDMDVVFLDYDDTEYDPTNAIETALAQS